MGGFRLLPSIQAIDQGTYYILEYIASIWLWVKKRNQALL
jgi:hypothetical protein